MKKTCGIFIVNDLNELLVCRVTGSNHYSIPKGVLETTDRDIKERALIETLEESNINLFQNEDKLIFLDSQTYRSKKKKIFGFFIKISKEFQNKQILKCNSNHEIKKWGSIIRVPEVDKYEWILIDTVLNNRYIHEAQLIILAKSKIQIYKQKTQI